MMAQTKLLQQSHKRQGMTGPQVSYPHVGIHRFETVRGCPNMCPFCYEPKDRTIFDIPSPLADHGELLNMNTLYHPDPVTHIRELGNTFKTLEAVCGFDYRLMTQEIAATIYEAGFIKVRLAWDWHLKEQYKLKTAFQALKKAGYKVHKLYCFMLTNWQVPLEVCNFKLDLLKVWNVKVCDCCYNGGYGQAVPEYWTPQEIKDFRRRCKAHNLILRHGIYPETATGLKYITRWIK